MQKSRPAIQLTIRSEQYVDEPNGQGRTPLSLAAAQNMVSVMEHLV
jgi:hypothetical protein